MSGYRIKDAYSRPRIFFTVLPSTVLRVLAFVALPLGN